MGLGSDKKKTHCVPVAVVLLKGGCLFFLFFFFADCPNPIVLNKSGPPEHWGAKVM